MAKSLSQKVYLCFVVMASILVAILCLLIQAPDVSAAEATKDVTLQNFLIKEYYQDTTNYVTFRNANTQISYVDGSGKTQIVYAGQVGDSGAIENVTLKDIPTSITNLTVHFYLGNDNLGFVTKADNTKYGFVTTMDISSLDPVNVERFTSFHSSTNPDSYYSNYTATKVYNFYQDIYDEQVQCVNYARSVLPSLSPVTFAPINVVWEDGYNLNMGSGFDRNGHLNTGTPNIVIGDADGLTDLMLKIDLVHEWAHWNMYRVTGMPGGSYVSHTAYNDNPQVSYKEGWASFQNNRYNFGYQWTFKNDTMVQDDPQLFGKSTNYIVRGVLMDLFDVNTPEELATENDNFDMAQRYLDDGMTDTQRDQLSEGIMYIATVESKATTLDAYLQYLESHYVITSSDKVKFQRILAINGLNDQGAFTLDEDGNPLN